MTERSRSAFSGYRFPDAVIALAVRWYLRFRLSYADVGEWLAARGVTGDPRTVYAWVRTLALSAPPRFSATARAHRTGVGTRWRVADTYLTIGGRWRYLERAIDAHGQSVDVSLRARRNAAAARTFFQQAIATSGATPTQVTTGCPLGEARSYPAAVCAGLREAEHRSSTYLNHRLERDHEQLKGRVRPMRRFKQVASAHNCCRGHTVIRNLMRGFANLTAAVPYCLRLARAWTVLATSL